MSPHGQIASMQLVANNDELTVRVSALASFSLTSAEEDAKYLEIYQELLGNVAEAAAGSGYAGLYELCQYFQQGIASLQNKSHSDNGIRKLLSEWPVLIQAYLASPSNLQTVEALIATLRSPVMALPISDGDVTVLTMMLDESFHLPGSSSQQTIDNAPEVNPEEEINISIDEELEKNIEGDQAFDFEPQEEIYLSLRKQMRLLQVPLNRLFASIITFYVGDGGVEAAEEYRSAVDVYESYLKRFGEAAKEARLLGLNRVTSRICENLELLASPGSVPSVELLDLLNDFVSHTRDYLKRPQLEEPRNELMDCLHADGWPKPLSSEEVREMLELFQLEAPIQNTDAPISDSSAITVAEDVRAVGSVATAEQISLELPADIEDDLFEIMMEELPELTGQFSEAVQNLVAGGTMEDLKVAQRMAHTLKGAGNTIGIKGVANLTHHMEDILIKFNEQGILPTRELSMTMVRVVDCLEGMGEALNNESAPPEDALAVLQEVLDWEYRIEQEGLPRGEAGPQGGGPKGDTSDEFSSLSTNSLSVAAEALSESMASMPALEAESPASRRRSNVHSSSTVRVPAALIDSLLRLAGEATIMTGLMRERVRQTIGRVQNLQGEFNRMHSLGAELERLIDIKDFSNPSHNDMSHTEFDVLEMDQYSELHSYSRMLAETATDSQVLGSHVRHELMSLEDMLVDQDMLNRETQDAVMDVCMVPASSIVPKLQRSVRQTARLTDKQVKLEVIGEDTQMDGDVLIEMADPLMHILRNAIDHGIESAEQRQQAGKDEEGTISLEFLREGTHVLVRCRDDGKGIDYDAIRRKAELLGVLRPEQESTLDDLKRILLMSNFSTRDEVTQTSGRGVGMDVVYSKIISMGGSLALESEQGIGTTFELRVPLTLISSHALLVRQGPTLLAVSDRGVLQILHGHDGKLEQEGDNVYYRQGDDRYPARFLETIMDLPEDRRDSDRSKRPVFLVQDEMGVSAVVVGEVLESLNLVIKGFGNYVANPVGIAGAAILGDGSVKPVIDLPDLLRHARVINTPMLMVPERTVAVKPERAMVMVVDDSRSARYILTKIIEAAGYIVRSAHDGMEALSLLEKRPADIVLSDMEMPRMNGIELTEQIRMSGKLSHIPVIMITSRSTQKHREEAESAGVTDYFTKPFDEKGLVNAVENLLGQTDSVSKVVTSSV